jgi:hypothetical protein
VKERAGLVTGVPTARADMGALAVTPRNMRNCFGNADRAREFALKSFHAIWDGHGLKRSGEGESER